MSAIQPLSSSLMRRVILIVLAVTALVVYWVTAYPTITWWDSSIYSLTASTLGLASSPGSLFLTLLGWLVTKFPPGLTPAHALNLFAGVLAAATVVLVYVCAIRLWRIADAGEAEGPHSITAPAAGAALGALTIAFGDTLWEHAIKFTPYVLTALFTGFILLTLLKWWAVADERQSWRWLLLLAFLFGLDFSVHRTNALLIPGAAAWILVRKPGVILRPGTWLAGIGGIVAGLAFQLLVIPIAAHSDSPLLLIESSTWPSFWDYVSLSQRGGGFLVEFLPRNAAFWSVQVRDFIRAFGDNFFNGASAAPVLGFLPLIAAAFGLAWLWRRSRRLGLAVSLLLFLQAAMTVLYFNIRANFFRPFDRHYLPVMVTMAVLVALGLGNAWQMAARLAIQGRRVLALCVTLVVIAAPVAQLSANWSKHDASNRWFARDYAANALGALPPNAIYFTLGDNDTFPLMYLQAAEGVRPDVRIVNLSLANVSWYVERIARRDSSFPYSRSEPLPDWSEAAELMPSTISVPVSPGRRESGLDDGAAPSDTVTLHPKPRKYMPFTPADVFLADVVETNAWRSPLCFSTTVGEDGLAWFRDFARLDGIFWRIVPVEGVKIDRELLRTNLLQRYSYRGYADPSVRLDVESRSIGFHYLQSLESLLAAEDSSGNREACQVARSRLLSAIPPDRIGFAEELEERLRSACG